MSDNKNKSVFISGKIKDLPFEQVMAKFKNAENFLRNQGFENIFNPPVHVDQNLRYEKQMEICINEVSKRDILFQLDDWPFSHGARRECSAALHYNKEITNHHIIIHDLKNSNYSDSGMDHKKL